ncbi:hypothetical protein L1887_54958 [Cichorium endivia]|nr:hypothetical protein L1887_54958 [Cichorium endivia]
MCTTFDSRIRISLVFSQISLSSASPSSCFLSSVAMHASRSNAILPCPRNAPAHQLRKGVCGPCLAQRGDEALERLVAVPLLSGLRRDLSPWYRVREPFQSAGGIEKGCTEAAGCSA